MYSIISQVPSSWKLKTFTNNSNYIVIFRALHNYYWAIAEYSNAYYIVKEWKRSIQKYWIFIMKPWLWIMDIGTTKWHHGKYEVILNCIFVSIESSTWHNLDAHTWYLVIWSNRNSANQPLLWYTNLPYIYHTSVICYNFGRKRRNYFSIEK